MSVIDLPKHPSGRVNWRQFFLDLEKTGTTTIRDRDAKRIHSNAEYYGVIVELKWISAGRVTVTKVDARKKHCANSTDIDAAEARHANLHNRIAEATTNRNFWKRQIELRRDFEAREMATAAFHAWKMTAERLLKEATIRDARPPVTA